MAGRNADRAEGAAGAAAGRVDLPADPGGIWATRRRRRRRRWWRERGPRPGKPLRPGDGHGEEPVRDRADGLAGGAAAAEGGRRVGQARCAGQAAGGTGAETEQLGTELPGSLAAGDVAARGGTIAARHGADAGPAAGTAGREWPTRTTGAIRATRTTGAARAAGASGRVTVGSGLRLPVCLVAWHG